MTMKEQYERLHHLERRYNYVSTSNLYRGFSVLRYCGLIIREMESFSDELYLAVQMSFGWRDESMSGWVNNDRRMRWERLRVSKKEPEHSGYWMYVKVFSPDDDKWILEWVEDES